MPHAAPSVRLFDSFLSEYEPSWRDKLLVVILFAAAAALSAVVSSVLPMVELRFHHIWQASLSTLTAAVPLSRRFVVASRNSERHTIAALSLLLCGLAYVAFPIWLQIIFEGSVASFQLAALIAWFVVVITWPVYVPAALLAGYMIAGLVRRRLSAPDAC